LVNRFIDYLQVVPTNKYNTIVDIHSTSSQSAFTSLYLATALHNGYSSALFPLDVSWYRILATEILLLPLPIPKLNAQLNCTRSLKRTRSFESYSIGAGPTRTPPATLLLLLRDVTAYVLTQSLHSSSCMRHVS
jgi:hypothetical protein